MVILAIIITAILSILGCYFCLRPKLKQTREIDKLTENHNIELSKKAQELFNLIVSKKAEVKTWTDLAETLKNNTQAMEDQAKETADIFYKENMEKAKANLEASLTQSKNKAKEDYDYFVVELESLKAQKISEYDSLCEEEQNNYQKLSNDLAQLQATVNAAVAAAKRQAEMQDHNNFYRIQLQNWEIEEISVLRSITPKLKNTEPLNKIIWKCYYEKPTTDLIGRVIGSGIHTGIYKITNINNNKCYVGQAVNLADRWKQHIRRGVGADAPTRNKLYPAMFEEGPENFTFEVIEECDRPLLDAREDYWQDFFKAKEFGYSIK